jgi:hypothetical protein
MLLSSILQILAQCPAQPGAEEMAASPPAGVVFSPGLNQIEVEIAAAGSLRPLSADPHLPPVMTPGSNLEELIQTIHKLKEPDQSRFVDVFE